MECRLQQSFQIADCQKDIGIKGQGQIYLKSVL